MSDTNRRILIVDDEKEILEALESAFLITDIEVHVSDDPIIALDMIRKTHYPVIISDIAMPRMNGLDLLRKIKAYNPFIQVIMITGYITVTNALNAFRYGAADCFFKPFEDPDEILVSVRESLNKMNRIKHFLDKVVSTRQFGESQ